MLKLVSAIAPRTPKLILCLFAKRRGNLSLKQNHKTTKPMKTLAFEAPNEHEPKTRNNNQTAINLHPMLFSTKTLF